MKITSETDLKALLSIAKEAAAELNRGENFLVRDLFRGFEWNRIAHGKRKTLGSLFLVYVEDEGKNIVKPKGKTSQNQQQYEKI